MFAGLDTLMYQTAFTEGNIDKKLNLGVNEPYGDLLHVHIWRLLSSTSVSRKKRVIFALNGNNASSEDLSRIGQIFAFNNISGQLEIKPFVRVLVTRVLYTLYICIYNRKTYNVSCTNK